MTVPRGSIAWRIRPIRIMRNLLIPLRVSIKRRYSAFFGTDLEILLKGLHVDTLYLIGGLTDVCIHYTAVDAHQRDYHIRVVTDAVAGSSEDAHRYALKAIQYLQRDALITAADIENEG